MEDSTWVRSKYWAMVREIGSQERAFVGQVQEGIIDVLELGEMVLDMANFMRVPVIHNSTSCRKRGAWGLYFGATSNTLCRVEVSPVQPVFLHYERQIDFVPADHFAGTIVHELAHHALYHDLLPLISTKEKEFCADIIKYLFCLSYGINLERYTKEYLVDYFETLSDILAIGHKWEGVIYSTVNEFHNVAYSSRYREA